LLCWRARRCLTALMSDSFQTSAEGAQLDRISSRIKHEHLREHERLRRFALRLRLSRSQREAVLNSDPSGLGGSIVLLDGRTILRNKYATLSYQQRKPSFKFGTSDEFGSVILLLSNKGVQLAGSQSLTQGQLTHSLLPKKNGASARQPKLPSIVREKTTS
jgi:hypothetical protein